MTTTVRIGFIGAGGNARGHMESVGRIEDAVIAAICDLDARRAQEAAERFSARPYTDARAMLAGEELDAVYLSLPVAAHGEPERAVIERGLPFFVEKPVARNLETARAIAAAVAEAGVITCVGYQLRYCGSADAAREILAGRPPGLVVGRYWCGSGRGDASHWIRRWEASGGQLVEQATHTLDLMRYFAGEIVEIYALQASRFLKEIDCPDTHALTCRFESGALGSLTTTWAFDPADWSQANRVDLLLDGVWLDWSPGALHRRAMGEQEERIERPGQSIDEVFIDAVRRGDGSALRSDYADAVKSLAVSLAANESARRGEPIAL